MSFENYLRLRFTEALFLHLLLSDLEDSLLPWEEVLRASIYSPKRKINMLLLGKTGNGKSATGNTVLGRTEFESKASSSSVTTDIRCGQVDLGDYLVNVIDSPGLADTKFVEGKVVEIEQMMENMENVIETCPYGIHAFLYVVRFASRFTAEEVNTLDSFRRIFGHDFLKKHGIIIFTYGDDYGNAMEEEETAEKEFRDWCRCQTGVLGDLMKECGYRCVLVNNREKNEKEKRMQMESLIYSTLGFDAAYTDEDFHQCKKGRNMLLVTLKSPQIKKTFYDRINILNAEFELACQSQDTSEDDIRHLELKTLLLTLEIEQEDKETGLLKDLQEKANRVLQKIAQYKKRQEESSRGCTIF